MRLSIAILLYSAISAAAHADTIAGRASIVDADTIEMHGELIRLLDIDAPESRQLCWRHAGPYPMSWRCGQAAALALDRWIGARTVMCETEHHDRYSRHLARCSVDGEDVAEWLAANGWAVPYRDCKCEVVRDAAAQAKAARAGIWSGTFQLPWEWRRAD